MSLRQNKSQIMKQISAKFGSNAYVEKKNWQMPEAETFCTQFYVIEPKVPYPVIRNVGNTLEELLKD